MDIFMAILSMVIPALLTRMSILPCWSSTSWTTRRQSWGLDTLPWWMLARPGPSKSRSNSLTNRSAFSRSPLYPAATEAPWLARLLQIEAPIPRVPPSNSLEGGFIRVVIGCGGVPSLIVPDQRIAVGLGELGRTRSNTRQIRSRPTVETVVHEAADDKQERGPWSQSTRGNRPRIGKRHTSCSAGWWRCHDERGALGRGGPTSIAV